MRLLQLHSDFIEYEPISKEIDQAEEYAPTGKIRLEELVVSLVSVEKGDDEAITRSAVNEIERYLDKVKSRRLLIYPYAHLTSELASPEIAVAVIRSIEKIARERLVDVNRAPFGWTKTFEIKVKGHPLSESYKVVSKTADILPASEDRINRSKGGWEEKVSSALTAEEKMSSNFYVLKPDGNLTPINQYKFELGEENLSMLVNYELAKKRSTDDHPPHVKFMKRLGIADYEPASDAGNLRYYPKGRLMKSLIEQFVTSRVMEYGGIEVETPIMYDSKHPSLESYFNRFPARQYNVTTDNDKQLFLRFAACFGQFLMAKDLQLTYKHLPLRLYELTRYSFRREKSGELAGLRRLRAFSMPDCHALCTDAEQAKEELLLRLELSTNVISAIGISPTSDTLMTIRCTEEFYNENLPFITKLASKFGRTTLIEIWKERYFYFTLKWEFNYVDSSGKASALSTDQIDVENGSRYLIEFVDKDGRKRNPIILHNSPTGAVERVMFALLDKCAKALKSGIKPSLPLWLAHTQVRLIPVSEHHIDHCTKVYDLLSARKVRADIDDRNESVANRIRQSEIEWISYTIVIGDNEIKSWVFTLRERNQSKQRRLTLEQLGDEINSLTSGKPYLPLNLPAFLSKRPQFPT